MEKFKNTKFKPHKQATLRITTVILLMLSIIWDAEASLAIAEEGTSGDKTTREGSDGRLTCNVTGYPEPRVFWQRANGELITIRNVTGDTYKVAGRG